MNKTFSETPLTPESADLESWLIQLDAEWEVAITDPNSNQCQELIQMEAAWEADMQLRHDADLYADRL